MTLVSHWLESSGPPSAWVSLDETDSDVRTLLRYVVEAVQPLLPGASEDVSRLLDTTDPPPPEALARHLVDAVDIIGAPFVLVLDDYHLIRETAIHEIPPDRLWQPTTAKWSLCSAGLEQSPAGPRRLRR
jgi:LuxR family maltose regulon positive regulatory protein